MLKNAVAFFVVAVLAVALCLASCGETDPAEAPAGAQIIFVGDNEGQLSITYGGVDDYGVTWPCYEIFVDLMIDYCIAAELNENPTMTEADAEAYCKAGRWVVWVEDYGELARDALRTAGRCGYYEMIITAMVVKGGEAAQSETAQSIETLNDIEVRWIVTNGAELYELADIPGEIPPLANPYITRTDDRGLIEVKVRVPLPNLPGSQSDYLISADIGVDASTFEIQMIAEDVSDEGTTTDDDDAADDDADDDDVV